MNANDVLAGSLGKAFVTIKGKRYNFLQLVNFEAKMDIKVKELAILGKTGKANKQGGWSGSWKATAYYNQSVLRKVLLDYKKNGIMPAMDIQIVNEDKSATIGRQTTVLKGCLLKGGILAKIDAGAENLEEDIEGTFDDFELPETFSLVKGMT